MAREQPSELEFRRFWQRLQALGLNAYEARSYLVLVGHPRFKALELAARAHVPRQKIYEVLDSLVEKGFARVIQDRTKLFSAVPPDQALPAYLSRRTHALEAELAEQSKAASGLLNDLMSAYTEGQEGGGAGAYENRPCHFDSPENERARTLLLAEDRATLRRNGVVVRLRIPAGGAIRGDTS